MQETDAERIALPLLCRSWTCTRCGPARRRRIVHLIGLAEPTSLLTLTCDPKLHASPDEALGVMSEALPKLIKRLRRGLDGRALEYLAVWELTRRGWPHLHILLRAPFIPHAEVRQHWLDLTGARIVDIRAVDSPATAGRYVAKHFTKQFDTPFTLRRFRASAAFFTEPMRPSQGNPVTLGAWRVERESVFDVLLGWWSNLLIVDSDERGVWTARTWDQASSNEAVAELLWRSSHDRIHEARAAATQRGPPVPVS